MQPNACCEFEEVVTCNLVYCLLKFPKPMVDVASQLFPSYYCYTIVSVDALVYHFTKNIIFLVTKRRSTSRDEKNEIFGLARRAKC